MAKKDESAPLSLYRAYRPKDFSEVRGQEEVVEVLQAALKRNKIAHAYLFAGSRGTGKTSMARILARELDTAPEDIYEMDAASNRGIDEVRSLREGVATLPFRSKYKFYIIDEAHALTRDAWGAFLKTLEEPPEHAIFVLATTELDKVPETIVSRCQVFQFKKPTREILQKLVLDIAKKEGLALSPASAELVALRGDGSFRDTLGLLQKVFTVAGVKKMDDQEVARIVGAPPAALVNAFLTSLAQKNIADALQNFHQAFEGGAEPNVFLLLAITKLRAVLLLRFSPKSEAELQEQFGPDELKLLKELSGAKGAALNSRTLAELLTALIETARAPLPGLPLELALYRLYESEIER